MLRAELLQWNTPENRFDVTSDMDLIAGESPCSDPWLDYVGKPLIQEITERFSSRVGEASVLQRVQNLGELSTNLVSRLAVDMLSPTIRKSRNGRPGAITTSINRSFPAGSATRHFLQLAAWRGSLATDPLFESFAGHPDTAPEVHRWQYASSHELKGLGSSDAESTRHLAAVEQHCFGRRGNRMRRRFPGAPPSTAGSSSERPTTNAVATTNFESRRPITNSARCTAPPAMRGQIASTQTKGTKAVMVSTSAARTISSR